MNSWLEYIFSPYGQYTTLEIVLEFIAAVTGIWSVILATKKKIGVYPYGIVSTFLYSILLYRWELFGDMLINVYYTIMSIYGWINWSKSQGVDNLKITTLSKKQYIYVILAMVVSFLLVISIYVVRFKGIDLIPTLNYMDSVMTACFLVAMWLMAKRKLEHWVFWIIGNCIAVPLFIYKGLAITAIQYFIFTLLAAIGWYQWYEEWEK